MGTELIGNSARCVEVTWMVWGLFPEILSVYSSQVFSVPNLPTYQE